MRSSALERESLRSAFMGAIVAPSWLRAKNFIVNVAYVLSYATATPGPFPLALMCCINQSQMLYHVRRHLQRMGTP